MSNFYTIVLVHTKYMEKKEMKRDERENERPRETKKKIELWR